ncbi:L-threonylcarbamoyladenylate synthase [Halobacteriovorax sp. HLS]|uniref:L-threonylcarbamoyladenylate synthase n=1 Tax=Halobacteriovorax sp. HLS TaxID=2234000 RepID=UPI000FD71CEB|nr:L-threonylcarbamoyladenylate synthase [Halobacteriovorax sp. HLS]
MIEYVIAESPDDRVLKKASDILKSGGLVCYPTDTNWLIVCDPFNKKGLEKLYRVKNEGPLKHYSLIADTISRAQEVAHIHDSAFKMIRKKVPGHYTFIFEARKKITRAVQANKSDKEVGVRFCPDLISQNLIAVHEDVLLSTHVTNELVKVSEGEEIYSYQIEEALRGQLDMIIDPGEYNFVGVSTIVNLTQEGVVEVLREGSGDWP